MTFWAHCTLSQMISNLLLLNEHKETLDFGLECPRHNDGMLLPPHIHLLLVFWFYFFFPFSFLLRQQRCSPCTWFLHIQEKKKRDFEYDA